MKSLPSLLALVTMQFNSLKSANEQQNNGTGNATTLASLSRAQSWDREVAS